MIPAPFEYEVAESPSTPSSCSAEDAKLIAGGHSLFPLRLRFARPALVDIGRLYDLRFVRDAGDKMTIGLSPDHNIDTTRPIA